MIAAFVCAVGYAAHGVWPIGSRLGCKRPASDFFASAAAASVAAVLTVASKAHQRRHEYVKPAKPLARGRVRSVLFSVSCLIVS